MPKKNIKKIITHNGNFHADDVFAVATVLEVLKKRDPKVKFRVLRTRDEEIIKAGDYVLDVGGEYDPRKNFFDHHQEGGAGVRENDVPYASFGLVWKKFGKTLSGSEETAERIDQKLAQPIDALDNGVDIAENLFPDIRHYSIQDLFFLFVPTWKETESDIDEIFLEMVDLAGAILNREIEKNKHKRQATGFVEKAYRSSTNKKIVVLNKNYPWRETLLKFKEPLFVIFPDKAGESWRVRTVPKSINSFENRKDLPRSWAGKIKEELAELTGVPDAIHCHNKLFIASAKSKKGALQLAELAVKNTK